MRTRLLLVDDHQVVRSGLRMLLTAEPDMEIVGEAERAEALQAVEAPGRMFYGYRPADQFGSTPRGPSQRSPATAVVALTIHEKRFLPRSRPAPLGPEGPMMNC
jgi:two-component system response regulator NreC